MVPTIPQPDGSNDYLSGHSELLIASYRWLLGKDLLPDKPGTKEMAKNLYYAPFVVLSHDTSTDPIFNYANLKALELFEFSWTEFVSTHSRLSAQAAHQPEREQLLREVASFGYSTDYHGIRISKSGRRFYIKNATVWNLHHPNGNYAGQAACFADWQFLD